MSPAAQAIVGLTIAFSYTLFGNAITQSFMGVPALLTDFPPPGSPEHAAAARRLGRQWAVFWAVGNVFFRPISTAGIAGYGFAAWQTATTQTQSRQDWRPYAVAAACHLATVVHSAVNMQPINARIEALARDDGALAAAERDKAEAWARRWARLNLVRLVMPLVAGSLALSQALKG